MSVSRRFDLVVAVASNGGIGYKGGLPWPRLGEDFKFLKRRTTDTADKSKQNAVIMGRKTWESLPPKYRPLSKRFNIVISSRKSTCPELAGAHMVSKNLTEAMEKLSSPPLDEEIESVYILGGSGVYEEAMRTPWCDKIYYTDVMAEFPSDTFFPPLDTTVYELTQDDSVPQGKFEENGVNYVFKVYQKTK